MDESFLREIHGLTRLVDHYKKKSLENMCCTEKSPSTRKSDLPKSKEHIVLLHEPQQYSKISNITNNKITSTNVYINPNFKPLGSAIHINPKLRLNVKPLVHVNPKMMKNVINSNENGVTDSTDITTNVKQNSMQTQKSVRKSVHVNPKLMKKLSSVIQSNQKEQKQITQTVTQPVCSRLKFVKNINTTNESNAQNKINNSSIVILSRRKLIRVRRGTRKSLSATQIELCKTKKSPTSIVKNVKSQRSTKTKIINALQQSISKDSNFTKTKINKYRIDRTVSKTNSKENVNINQKKIVNKKLALVTIGGIVYKSSKNQLVRRSYGVKKKRATNVKTDKFIVATNGKKLRRIKTAKETPQNNNTKAFNTYNAKLLSAVFQKTNYKNNISTKVKQRSIQILRNKMRKNNQPCLIFQRFGFCTNHENGICPKHHDKKQISLCKKFLQGNCLLDKCPLSHDVGPEKMPTCKYFLEGCCTRDACPYRHIKVSASTPICIEFLKGYCAGGSECKQRHEYLCPEFEKMQRCNKGKYCPYPHKLHSSVKQNHLKRKYEVSKKQAKITSKEGLSSNSESTPRYYEHADTLSKNINKRGESVMKRVEVAVHSDITIENSNKDTSVEVIEDNNCEEEVKSDAQVLRRPPIGVLPAYIPIG